MPDTSPLNPLSFAQQRMWFFNQLEPEAPVYNGSRPSRWRGLLDVGALERALAELVRRHETLRTRFPLTDRGVCQEVAPADALTLPLRDATGVSPAEREAWIRRWLVADARRPFDLTGDLPFRATLVRLADDDHVLALVIHHIAFDRWSRGLLRQELGALYSAFAAGRPSPVPDPTTRYLEYARHQRERVDSGALDGETAYWRRRLQGAPPVTALPVDRPRPRVQTHAGRQLDCRLPTSLVEALARCGRQQRATLFMVLLAGFKTLLWDATGATDLIVGTPTAGRLQTEFESLIGCFTNTLVLRTDISGNLTFRELVDRVREGALEAYSHLELPFERLVEELRPERNPAYHPMFQVLFNYLDFQDPAVEIPGLQVEELDLDLEVALVELSLDVRRSIDGLTCSFTYNTDLFDPGTIRRVATRFQRLLERAAEAPDARLSALVRGTRPMSDDTERLLQELEQLSEDDAERLLAAERERTR